MRENTEGEYAGLEHEVVPGVVESLKARRWPFLACREVLAGFVRAPSHPSGLGPGRMAGHHRAQVASHCALRVRVRSAQQPQEGASRPQGVRARRGVAPAQSHRLPGRPQVTCVHKANIMKLTDGLFLKARPRFFPLVPPNSSPQVCCVLWAT